MSDFGRQAALRVWRVEGGEEARDVAIAEHRRADLALPWDLLASSPRWSRHVSFVAKWFERPLGPRDGLSVEAVERRERELGSRLPWAVREWYQLIGRRLEVGDGLHSLSPLAELQVDGGKIDLAWDNQGAFAWVADGLDAEDPFVRVDGSDRKIAPASEFLLAFLVEQVGYYYGRAPAGLRAGVRRGYTWQFTCDLALNNYAALPVQSICYEASFGDSDTIVVWDGEILSLAARVPRAWAKANRVFGDRWDEVDAF